MSTLGLFSSRAFQGLEHLLGGAQVLLLDDFGLAPNSILTGHTLFESKTRGLRRKLFQESFRAIGNSR